MKNITSTEKEPMEANVKDSKIKTLAVDFGRDDLNELKDKVNEIITKLNGC